MLSRAAVSAFAWPTRTADRCRAGVTGECQIRRRGLAPHYWNDKKRQQGLLTSDGWLRTGDLATRNRLGLIRLVGRMKDVIKSGGYSVYVRELEEAMLAHPAVARAVAFGLPHKEKGEIPAAAVELHAGLPGSEVESAGVVPAESCRVQSAPPHLDSRCRRPAAESQRQVSAQVFVERFSSEIASNGVPVATR